MKIRKRQRRKPIIPINSMSDIAFLLLIFIMLLSLINYKKEIPIDFAEAKYQEKTQNDINFEIWVDKEGAVYYKAKNIEMSELQNLISKKITRNPETRFHVIADRDLKYKKINDLIEILKSYNISAVSLVVRENEK